jgi:hypothetical protein
VGLHIRMAAALAPDLETALAMLDKKAGYHLDLPVDRMTVIDLAGEIEPQTWYIHGGG